ncbi:MAG: RNase H-like domain-containing protein [Pseudomonadota bacterium]
MQTEDCKWNDIAKSEIEEEMVKLRLLAGMKDQEMMRAVLRNISEDKITVQAVKDFVQQMTEVTNFTSDANKSNDTHDVYYTKGSKQKKNNQSFRFDEKKIDCTRCGRTHSRRNCPAYQKICSKCGKLNHFAKMCVTILDKDQTERKTENHYISEIFNVDSDHNELPTDPLMRKVTVNDQVLTFQIDTGATTSVMTKSQWVQIGKPTLKYSNTTLRNFDNTLMKTLGECWINIKSKEDGINEQLRFHVVHTNKAYGLLGRNSSVVKNYSNKKEYSVNNSEDEFLPTIKDVKASIKLKDDADMIFMKARPVPLAMRQEISDELDKLQKKGVISPIKFASMASPVVWVRKSNNALRLCADFKATLNPRIMNDSYPIPSIEQIFAGMNGASHFSKIDLQSAYNQIELDEPSKKLSVINTTKGLYTINRLQMGMKNSSAIFQRTMEQILSGIPNVIIYQDDILLYENTEAGLKKIYDDVIKRLKEHNVTLNSSKSIMMVNEISYLGYKINSNGIQPDERLTQRVKAINVPTCRAEVEQFMGLINYFGRLIPNVAEISSPLNDLRKRSSGFYWSEECNDAFNKLKSILSSNPVVKPFEINEKCILTTDASKVSIGSVLMQNNRPVIFASRKLTKAEQNYSNIEREALAVFWSVRRLKNFLLGNHFEINTDHKPLVRIFAPDQITKDQISPRLERWSLAMSRYSYNIKYVPGSEITHADALSRLDISDTEDNTKLPQVHFISSNLVSDVKIADETKTDHFLQEIINRVKNGNWKDCTIKEKPYKRRAHLFTVENGILRLKQKYVIPAGLVKKVISTCHEHHLGINKTLYLIKKEFWWPNLQCDVMQFVNLCESCRGAKSFAPREVHKWPDCGIWERIHMDWAYDSQIGNILVVVDAGSGWVEARITNTRRTEEVIGFLRELFSRFGVPKSVVTDNAKEFIATPMQEWLNNVGSRLINSPIYFPMANGRAEKMVQLVKNGLKAARYTNAQAKDFLNKLLFAHRNSPGPNGRIPAQLMLGREVRCPLVTKYATNQEVVLKPNKSTTIPARFVMRKGGNTSYVKDGSTVIVAHDDQITPADVQGRRQSTRISVPPNRFGNPISWDSIRVGIGSVFQGRG